MDAAGTPAAAQGFTIAQSVGSGSDSRLGSRLHDMRDSRTVHYY